MNDQNKEAFSLDVQRNPSAHADLERRGLKAFAESLARIDIPYRRCVEYWVTLKSVPKILFYGSPQESGTVLATRIASAVAGSDNIQHFQGHPWWAVPTRNGSTLAMAQQRLTAQRLRYFMHDAASSDAGEALSFAVISRLSRAELAHLFSTYMPGIEIPDLRFPSGFEPASIPFPSNVYLLGTTDLEYPFNDISLDEHSCLMEIDQRLTTEKSLEGAHTIDQKLIQAALRHTRCFDPMGALSKIPPSENPFGPLQFFWELNNLLADEVNPSLVRGAYIINGNAWDGSGKGLWSADQDENTRAAFDFWLSHFAVPYIAQEVQEGVIKQPDALKLLERHSQHAASKMAYILEYSARAA
ncbi:MAG: hypothetical protein P1P76_04540 [Anaerolineales bacterium]|nr:hypothetical protein [Anaerolineales bacterium]